MLSWGFGKTKCRPMGPLIFTGLASLAHGLENKESQNRETEAATHQPDDECFSGGGNDRSKDEGNHGGWWLIVSSVDRRPSSARTYFFADAAW